MPERVKVALPRVDDCRNPNVDDENTSSQIQRTGQGQRTTTQVPKHGQSARPNQRQNLQRKQVAKGIASRGATKDNPPQDERYKGFANVSTVGGKSLALPSIRYEDDRGYKEYYEETKSSENIQKVYLPQLPAHKLDSRRNRTKPQQTKEEVSFEISGRPPQTPMTPSRGSRTEKSEQSFKQVESYDQYSELSSENEGNEMSLKQILKCHAVGIPLEITKRSRSNRKIKCARPVFHCNRCKRHWDKYGQILEGCDQPEQLVRGLPIQISDTDADIFKDMWSSRVVTDQTHYSDIRLGPGRSNDEIQVEQIRSMMRVLSVHSQLTARSDVDLDMGSCSTSVLTDGDKPTAHPKLKKATEAKARSRKPIHSRVNDGYISVSITGTTESGSDTSGSYSSDSDNENASDFNEDYYIKKYRKQARDSDKSIPSKGDIKDKYSYEAFEREKKRRRRRKKKRKTEKLNSDSDRSINCETGSSKTQKSKAKRRDKRESRQNEEADISDSDDSSSPDFSGKTLSFIEAITKKRRKNKEAREKNKMSTRNESKQRQYEYSDRDPVSDDYSVSDYSSCDSRELIFMDSDAKLKHKKRKEHRLNNKKGKIKLDSEYEATEKAKRKQKRRMKDGNYDDFERQGIPKLHENSSEDNMSSTFERTRDKKPRGTKRLGDKQKRAELDHWDYNDSCDSEGNVYERSDRNNDRELAKNTQRPKMNKNYPDSKYRTTPEEDRLAHKSPNTSQNQKYFQHPEEETSSIKTSQNEIKTPNLTNESHKISSIKTTEVANENTDYNKRISVSQGAVEDGKQIRKSANKTESRSQGQTPDNLTDKEFESVDIDHGPHESSTVDQNQLAVHRDKGDAGTNKSKDSNTITGPLPDMLPSMDNGSASTNSETKPKKLPVGKQPERRMSVKATPGKQVTEKSQPKNPLAKNKTGRPSTQTGQLKDNVFKTQTGNSGGNLNNRSEDQPQRRTSVAGNIPINRQESITQPRRGSMFDSGLGNMLSAKASTFIDEQEEILIKETNVEDDAASDSNRISERSTNISKPKKARRDSNAVRRIAGRTNRSNSISDKTSEDKTTVVDDNIEPIAEETVSGAQEADTEGKTTDSFKMKYRKDAQDTVLEDSSVEIPKPQSQVRTASGPLPRPKRQGKPFEKSRSVVDKQSDALKDERQNFLEQKGSVLPRIQQHDEESGKQEDVDMTEIVIQKPVAEIKPFIPDDILKEVEAFEEAPTSDRNQKSESSSSSSSEQSDEEEEEEKPRVIIPAELGISILSFTPAFTFSMFPIFNEYKERNSAVRNNAALGRPVPISVGRSNENVAKKLPVNGGRSKAANVQKFVKNIEKKVANPKPIKTYLKKRTYTEKADDSNHDTKPSHVSITRSSRIKTEKSSVSITRSSRMKTENSSVSTARSSRMKAADRLSKTNTSSKYSKISTASRNSKLNTTRGSRSRQSSTVDNFTNLDVTGPDVSGSNHGDGSNIKLVQPREKESIILRVQEY